MPYKMEYTQKRIPETHDKRVKLITQDKDDIVAKHASGLFKITELANEYNVSISTIRNIIKPVNRKPTTSTTYDKEKRRVATKAYRERKVALLNEGLLLSKEEYMLRSEIIAR